ncbi:sensor histidine kinase [Devosia oryziradicis]|uniref:histidine kinase n=1 Tax=Devosia oryziradicis TaxID=2801335 RepID=A0ABX7C2L2_9HYPH|nr:ATP-binding protein [Devosia oryziradicis]QQR37032.1 sensor histidine kinase [Devosia oryziradicis]
MATRFGFRDLLQRRQMILVGAAIAIVVLTGWAAFEIALTSAIASAGQQADRRLSLFDRTLEAIIERFHYLPSSIALAAETRAVLADPQNPERREAANGFLSRLNDTAGAGELFVMDPTGAVVAASNWWAYDSFVGENLGYRPYFEEAMRDGDARFYAVGTVTGVAGYFLARRIDGSDGPLGVAVTKVNLGEIEANWWRSGELIVIVDSNNVAILSTRPDWRYRPLAVLESGAAERIAAQRRYGSAAVLDTPVASDIWPSRGTQFAWLAGPDPDASGIFILDELRLPTHQWRIISFTSVGPLFRAAWIAAAAAALAVSAALLIVLLLVQRQRIVAQRLAEHDRLEQRVAERTEDLHVTNQALRDEIAERIRAEKAERDAQHGLVQAAKMASLGQALAGVAHEVSQPVAALTTHIASAKLVAARHGDADIGQILGTMDKVVDRLSALTGHLKTFARKETRVEMEADLGQVIANALDLVDHKLKAFGVDVEYRRHRGRLMVSGNPVHLEQVLINLIANAADAMEHSAVRVLSIGLSQTARTVEVSVADTGSGIEATELANLFDPFYSTKQAGRGLGLGLSISYGLVRDIGGAIVVESRPGQGSTFTVRLPLVAELSAPAPPSPLRGGSEGGGAAAHASSASASNAAPPPQPLPSRGRGRRPLPSRTTP